MRLERVVAVMPPGPVDQISESGAGSRIEAAKKFGVDLTLLIEQLRLEPGERARRLHGLAQTAERVRGVARPK